MKLSIVATMYYSASYVKEFCERISKVVPDDFSEFEIILVDDGSPDDSLQLALEHKKKIPQIKVVELSRNFGHHKAILTGLEQATGDYVFLIDIDLEEDPELLSTFYGEMAVDPSLDVVYGVQEKRKGGLFEQLTGDFFYNLLNKLSDIKVPSNVLVARLMKSKYVKHLISLKESEVFILGMYQYVGFNQKGIYAKKHGSSPTTYTLIKKLQQFIDAITSFSSKPLYLSFYLGVLIFVSSIIYALYLIFKKFFLGIHIEGWTSLIVVTLFSNGVILILLGIVGIYLSKMFNEVKKRPRSIIKQ